MKRTVEKSYKAMFNRSTSHNKNIGSQDTVSAKHYDTFRCFFSKLSSIVVMKNFKVSKAIIASFFTIISFLDNIMVGTELLNIKVVVRHAVENFLELLAKVTPAVKYKHNSKTLVDFILEYLKSFDYIQFLY